MKANIKLLKKQRKYSDEFKRSIVKEFESGKFSVYQLERLHGVSNPTIYGWVHKFSNFNEKGSRIVEMKNSSDNKLKALEKKIKELEQAVGQKQIKIDYLEKMMEIANDELNIDIKKNYSTQQQTGSGKTKQK